MLLLTTIISQNMILLVNASIEKNQIETEDIYFKYHPLTYIESYQMNRRHLESSIETQENVNDCHEKKNDEFIVAAVQLKSLPSKDDINTAEAFFDRAVNAIETAVKEHNASLVLLQELFLGPYFCQSQESSFFSIAEDFDLITSSPLSSSSSSSSCLGNNHEKQYHSNNIMIQKMQSLAKQYGVILPISIFETKNNMYYNSVVMINASGDIVGVYRKSHIPDGTGYQEKFYFSPGDTGFQIFSLPISKNSKDTIKIGVGICWDQWFPEAARSMALMGADLLLYPTAIGSEPQDPTLDSSDHWQRVMQGHAAANVSFVCTVFISLYLHTIKLNQFSHVISLFYFIFRGMNQ